MDRNESLRRAVKEISDAQRAIRSAENRSGQMIDWESVESEEP